MPRFVKINARKAVLETRIRANKHRPSSQSDHSLCDQFLKTLKRIFGKTVTIL